MSLEIARGHTVFRFGIKEPVQLEEWLQNNPDAIGVGLVGRSNVGKSSIINSLFGKKTARVSNTPGRTREINIFTFHIQDQGKIIEELPAFYLFDLPGYGFAEVPKPVQKNWEELMALYFDRVSRNVLMLNLQDARHPQQRSDLQFQDFLKSYNLETFLVFNKIDKLKTQKERAALDKMKPKLFSELKWVKQIYFASAESQKGIAELESALIQNFLLKIERAKHL